MPRQITPENIKTDQDMQQKIKILEAYLTDPVFLEVNNRNRMRDAIPRLQELVDRCNPDNFEDTRNEFLEIYNSLLDAGMPNIDMQSTT